MSEKQRLINEDKQRLRKIARMIHNSDKPKEETGINLWHLSEQEIADKEEKSRLEAEESNLNPEQRLNKQLDREIKRLTK